MVELLRHRQTKEAATDMFSLKPPRHISTPPDSGGIAGIPQPPLDCMSPPQNEATYLRVLFVQAAWVVLVKLGPKQWESYGLNSWIEAAKKRLHHDVLAIALANKLARIAWAVLNK